MLTSTIGHSTSAAAPTHLIADCLLEAERPALFEKQRTTQPMLLAALDDIIGLGRMAYRICAVCDPPSERPY
jgi:hypothetical protein